MALIVGAVVIGLLADRWRRRDVVVLGVLCWSAITWGTGRARTFLQLLPARVGMHFFLSAFGIAAYPMLGNLVPRHSRGMVMGLLGATFAVGTVVALVIVALIGTENWRKPFAYFDIPGVLLGLLVLFFVREPVRGGREEEVMAAGGYAGQFSWRALQRTFRIRTALRTYLLDACQGSTWWAFSFWAPAYLIRYQIAPDADTAALALVPAIAGFVVGTLAALARFERWRAFTHWLFRSHLITVGFDALIFRALADMSACRNSTIIPLLSGQTNVSFFCTGGITWGLNHPYHLTSGWPWPHFQRAARLTSRYQSILRHSDG